MLAALGAAAVVWAVSLSRRWRTLLVAAVPAVLLTGVLVAAMTPSPEGGQSVIAKRGGAIAADPVTSLDELHAQALDVADQLVDGGSTQLQRMNLFTDLSSGSIIEVADGSGGFLRARLETHPQREWQWEAQDRDVPADTFDGRRVTFSYDPVIEQLTAAAETIGTAPSFESVWLYPGQSSQQSLAAANPQALPVAQFNSRARGRDLRPQVLGDGTLPDTFFEVTDLDAARGQINEALLLDARSPSTAQFQTLSARSSTQLLDGPAIDDRPLDGGVEFRGTVDGDYLQVAVHVGQFPAIYSRTADEDLGFHPLADVPADSLAQVLPATDHPVAWQLRVEDGGPVFRIIDSPGAPEQRHEL